MKLEDIKKKNIYTVPDNYFDQLPTKIQSRINEKTPVFRIKLSWSLVFKVATPAFAMIMILFYFGLKNNNTYESADEILSQVSSQDLIAYLETTDITTDEIIEEIDFTDVELDFYEDGSIMQDIEMNKDNINTLLDEYGIDTDIL